MPRISTARLFAATILLALVCTPAADVTGQSPKETLPELGSGAAPSNFEQMWAGFDPRAEPLETEVIKQWEEDGVVLQIVRFRIGVFKGNVSRLAAVYGYPKNIKQGEKIPGLLQIHGGGQYADQRAVVTNAKRGYATVSIAWAGRISATGYRVNPEIVKLFWDGKTDDSNYKLTTDWGAVDGYHAPGRNPGNDFPSAKPYPWTIDSVESPRNSPWFLCALAGRRALTFLERQPQVNGERLGVYGHSMGGKLTVLIASDKRVKAAVPSCGGISDRYNDSELFQKTVGDDPNLKQVSCPIAFLSPANDFHGRIGDLPRAAKEIASQDWRVACSSHLSHRDTGPFFATGLLWFDQHLKRRVELPETPKTKLDLRATGGTPVFHVHPDSGETIRSVEVFYTQHGKPIETSSDRNNSKSRFWHYVKPKKEGNGRWAAPIPIANIDKPVWVYANVEYQHSEAVVGAGYYYEHYKTDTFVLSSLLKKISPEMLKEAGVKATLKPTMLVEDFQDDWKKQWYKNNPGHWKIETHKIYDQTFAAPDFENVELAFGVQSAQENTLLVIIEDKIATVAVKGGAGWQDIKLAPSDFKDFDGQSLPSWKGIRTIGFSDTEHQRGKKSTGRRVVGKKWNGDPPTFRQLRWKVNAIKTDESKQGSSGTTGVNSKMKQAAAVDSDSHREILALFPKSTVEIEPHLQGQSKLSQQFSGTKSLWTEGLDERKVFHGEMTHAQDEGNSYSLRIGKGGQVYSLRGSFGESVPPSWRRKGGVQSPWNDEVWQFVAVCTKYNGLDRAKRAGEIPQETIQRIKDSGYADSFFVHNSGAYIPENLNFNSLYCPLLSSEVDQKDRSFRMLNWGLVPQIKTIHRSPVLFYTQVRDVGNGVIELTWVVHNFSVHDDVVFDHLNAPWGGTRISSLPFRYATAPDGTLLEREEILNSIGVVKARKTAGWNISSAGHESDSPTLALVYGRDKHLESERRKKTQGKPYAQFSESLYRDWRASVRAYDAKGIWEDWKDRPANSYRNYDVCEVIPKLRIAPGTSIWYRSFLVVGPQDKVIKQASDLVEQVDYGLLEFEADKTQKINVAINGDKIKASPGNLQASNGENKTGKEFSVFARPVAGTKPLFLIQHSETGQKVVTTDPYVFVPQEKLNLQFPQGHSFAKYYSDTIGYRLDKGISQWKGMLGFGYEKKPDGGQWVQLSSLLDESNFPAVTKFHLDLWVGVSN